MGNNPRGARMPAFAGERAGTLVCPQLRLAANNVESNAAANTPALTLFFDEPAHVEGVVPVQRPGSTGDFHDMPGMIDGGLAEDAHAVPPRVLFFFPQHVQPAVFVEQAERRSVA